jgi:hypothetical protein
MDGEYFKMIVFVLYSYILRIGVNHKQQIVFDQSTTAGTVVSYYCDGRCDFISIYEVLHPFRETT